MRQEWSNKWKSSTQPRKQRKYRANAPLHIKRKFLSVNLTKPLRERFGKRTMVVRKGDEVIVLRGSLKGSRGNVEKVDLSSQKVYVENIKVKKVDGSEVPRGLTPSNLQITKLSVEDKQRQKVLERAGPGKKESE
ncbi:MAG: 50S ribosomal protein L24 [Candidatus Aenigmatarchaeota archaeon]|nr:MAG: 50S ribosomal protein L24 [Candidatus Aenigmarchaeota archaeon]